MKLLFDQNLSARLCGHLRDIFPGSAQTGQIGLAEATDAAVWSFAREEGFMLVTKDADFSELAALVGPPPKVIWVRCGNRPTTYIVDLLRRRSSVITAFAGDERTACLEIG